MQRLLLILSLLLFALPAHAACDGPSGFWSLPADKQQRLQDRADRVPHPEGILWQVEKGGVTSFILGTMHLPDPRHTATLDRLQPLLDKTEQVFLEMTADQDAAFQAHLTAHPDLFLLTEGPSLIDLLGDENWQRILPAIKARGVPGFVAAKFQPWYLGITLAIPACAIQELRQKMTGIDRMVEKAAADRNLTIRSLDDVGALLQMLGGDPMEVQVADLKWAVQFGLSDTLSGGSDLSDHYFREQVQLGWEYLQDKTLNKVGSDPAAREKVIALLDEMEKELVDGRNGAWVETLAGELAQTPSLVAVGALHLPGENGVLALLERQGFTVTRLPLTSN